MFAFGSVNWARPTIHTLLHMPYMILRSRADQATPKAAMMALENNVETRLALTNGPATGSKREHSASDDGDEKADVQEKAAQQKRGRGSVSSTRLVLESGTSKAKQLGVLVKQKNIWFVQLSDCLVVTSLYSPLSLSLSLRSMIELTHRCTGR